jgi:NAD+ synthase
MNPCVGDIVGNTAVVRAALESHPDVDLIITPEHAVLGYPSEDLVLKPSAVAAAMAAARGLAQATRPGGPALLVGCPWAEDGVVYNAALLLQDGEITHRTYKHELPNYGVFDDKRVYAPGPLPEPLPFRGFNLGVAICEDVWLTAAPKALAKAGAQIVIALNASPYRRTIYQERIAAVSKWREQLRLPLLFVNQVGGQDELVFDGASFALDGLGQTVAQAPAWREAGLRTEWSARSFGLGAPRLVCQSASELANVPQGPEADYTAAVQALRDYVAKNRFKGVLLGLSGGIDSALTAAMAVDAVGAEAVGCYMLPSRYTSTESLDDAAACALALGVRLATIPIEPAVEAFGQMLAAPFAGHALDQTEENIQSRIRGVTLMALSNKSGHLLLTTGNKSEMAVGYATLYGDMCGAYNCLKDLYKVEVYALARWRNADKPVGGLGPSGRVIPERIFVKAPTAELRANQTDQDSLPPYPVLDAILRGLVDEEMSVSQLVGDGHDLDTVRKVERLLYLSEFKRYQAAPGVKLSGRAFGRDRRYPLTNRYRDSAEGH